MTCQCGATYHDTTDGRGRHRLIYGHTPSKKVAAVR